MLTGIQVNMQNVLFTDKLRRRWYVCVVLAAVSLTCFYSRLNYWNNDLQVIKIFNRKIPTDVDEPTNCQMDNCFKYRNCPTLTNLSFKLLRTPDTSSGNRLDAALLRSDARVEVNNSACITVLVLKECEEGIEQLMRELAEIHYETNIVIWMNFAKTTSWNCLMHYHSILKESVNILHRSIVISSFVTRAQFRDGYDIVPSYINFEDEEVFAKPMPRRDILAYFDETCSAHRDIVEILFEKAKQHRNSDSIPFKFTCSMFTTEKCVTGEVAFKTSVFTVISLPPDTNILSTPELQEKLFNILRLRSIPVLIGQRFLFPFSELIDWSKIGIKIPVEHLPDLLQILNSYSENVQEAMRINGRLVFNEYFSSLNKSVKAVLNTISSRLSLPGIYHVPKFGESETALSFNLNGTRLEISNQSSTLRSPYISASRWVQTSSLWAQHFNNVETELNSSISLPSSLAHEKFTIVVMTYNRVKELMKLLAHLNGLPKVDKIVVVWNSPDQPSTNLSWPSHMTVPIHVIKTFKNCLNNRFFPFEAIRTDAILSLDDDIYVSHENLLLGFRVWQENRDRLVGFPGRAVTMEPVGNQWQYDTKHTYPISLILTGCTFIHKMYQFLYTFEMSPLIRSIVDEYMNCEDIAMNFLIAHRTQKPPIKVTKQDSFNCPTCGAAKNSLWTKPGHFEERNKCITGFTKIYGYMALFNTEYLASDLIQNKKERLGRS